MWVFSFFCAYTPSVFYSYLDFITQSMLAVSLVYGNAFYYFSAFFPGTSSYRVSKLNALLFVLFFIAVFNKYTISNAHLLQGKLMFDIGPGYFFFSIYMFGLGVGGLYHLIKKYKQPDPQLKSQLRVLFLSMALFIISASLANLVLPILGYKEFVRLGPISTIFIVLGFSYAITKHELLGIRTIINRIVAYGLIFVGVILTTLFIFSVTTDELTRLCLIIISGIIWAVYGGKMRQFLQTSTDRFWVSDWYNPQDVVRSIASRLSHVFDRQSIVLSVATVLDDILQLKEFHIIVLDTQERDTSSTYIVYDKKGVRIHQFTYNNAFIQAFSKIFHPVSYKSLSQEVFAASLPLEISKYAVVIPLHSPETLEAIVVVGQRASEADYLSTDMELFEVIITTVGVFLDRMRPYEKIQSDFNQNQKKLYDLERKVAQSEKIAALTLAVKEYNHELKTPLSIIRMAVDQLTPSHNLEMFKKDIFEQIDRSLLIINQSLSLSSTNKRVETQIYIHDVISPSLKLVPSHIVLKQDIPQELALKGVQDDLVMVFTNLIKNACESMTVGGVLTVTASKENEDIVVHITDTGYGIPRSDIPKVWDPFFVGEKKKTFGHGLGLSVVFRIVSDHLGHVVIDSEEGKGTTVTVKLPVI